MKKRLEQLKEEQRVGLKESVKVLSLYDNHPADLGTASYERELDEGLMEELKRDLYLVQEALERMEEGKFGICMACGEPISSKRLEALPEASFCTLCQQEKEEKGIDTIQ